MKRRPAPSCSTLLALVAAVLLAHAVLCRGIALILESVELSRGKVHSFHVLQLIPAAHAAEPAQRKPAAPNPAPAKTRQQRTSAKTVQPPAQTVASDAVSQTLPAKTEPTATSAVNVSELKGGETPSQVDQAPPTNAVTSDTSAYPTLFAPTSKLEYELRRGHLAGHAELIWRRSEHQYELQLKGSVMGFEVLAMSSHGSFDTAGLAPTRFTDQRRGRALQAANFQRTAGKITYSGPSTEFPLHVGAQDRLSWMIQLSAIAAAAPQFLMDGNPVALFVTGARGDGDVWTFRFQQLESVTTNVGAVRTIKLLREPRKPHDNRVEIWLDPAQHYLPVRMRQTTGADGDSFELRLQEAHAMR